MPAVSSTVSSDRDYVKTLIETLVRECPRRAPASDDERRAQEMMEVEMKAAGLTVDRHAFTFGTNLYANIALHFGLGSFGTLISGVFPLGGLLLHGLAAGSYWAESTRRAYLLRRLLGFKPSQNILGVLPAEGGEPKLRIVVLGHADAAYTGFLFSERMVKMAAKSNIHALKRSMALTTHSMAALMGFDALRLLFGPLTWPLRPIEYALTVPSFLAFVLNMEAVLRNEIVPGANDNLSGTAALPILAKRLAKSKPADVELVFGVTGCEEASLGGADALARDMEGVWDKSKTVILGLDTLTNGELQYVEIEGEVTPMPIPAWLKDTLDHTAASEPRFNPVKGFEIPVGGTDVAAFLAHGWEGVCLTALDPELGAPRHYHLPSDTPENLDLDQLMLSIDFAEQLIREIMKRRG